MRKQRSKGLDFKTLNLDKEAESQILQVYKADVQDPGEFVHSTGTNRGQGKVVFVKKASHAWMVYVIFDVSANDSLDVALESRLRGFRHFFIAVEPHFYGESAACSPQIPESKPPKRHVRKQPYHCNSYNRFAMRTRDNNSQHTRYARVGQQKGTTSRNNNASP